MGKNIRLTADDGHELDAYVAESAGPARAAIVVVQEIFGVNSHIRSVADGYAAEGFLAIAPALFDRAERHVELGYGPAEMQQGMRLATQVGIDAALKDVAAAMAYGRKALGKKVGVVGFCFGGSLAWLAATRLGADAAVGYYGGRIASYAAEVPGCPVMLHFGRKDPHIAMAEVDKIRAAHPDLPVFLYDAGHGFNCDQRKDFEPGSARLARQRTLEFLRQHL